MLEIHLFFLVMFTPFSICEVGGAVRELRSGTFSGNFGKIAKVVLEISCVFWIFHQNSAQLFFFRSLTCGVFGVLPKPLEDLQGPSVAGGLGSSISSGRSHVTRLGSTTTSPVPMSWATQMGLHKPHLFLL